MTERADSPTMTVPELAQRVGVDASTAYRYLRAGSLPGVQAGNAWIIDRARVERFCAGQEDAQGRPLVHASPLPDARVLTLLPEREPTNVELALHWLRGARAAVELVCADVEARSVGATGAEQRAVGA